ncbi:hypothetical protein GE118_04075 [Mycoplasma sp. NEAQ87857]|uniref:hypothetical protein n=1 Tax=Mycoplasma sp. NEAQ87857 TaxID=2683967 RepID=UPI001317E8E6|nr:hypothetical protein [Mycoplasma sp. NEAQ87857]QGZ97953.1 hypothetical protein GE118_04075 [Mycoplasma sp. NEAQ87857]
MQNIGLETFYNTKQIRDNINRLLKYKWWIIISCLGSLIVFLVMHAIFMFNVFSTIKEVYSSKETYNIYKNIINANPDAIITEEFKIFAIFYQVMYNIAWLASFTYIVWFLTLTSSSKTLSNFYKSNPYLYKQYTNVKGFGTAALILFFVGFMLPILAPIMWIVSIILSLVFVIKINKIKIDDEILAISSYNVGNVFNFKF